MVSINGEYLMDAVKNMHVAQARIARVIGGSDNYINTCCSRGKMRKANLEKLCDLLAIDIKDVVLESPSSKTNNAETNNSSFDNEMVVAGINAVCLVLKDILTELKTLNSTVSSTKKLLDDQYIIIKSVHERISESNSNISFIKGKVHGIYNDVHYNNNTSFVKK